MNMDKPGIEGTPFIAFLNKCSPKIYTIKFGGRFKKGTLLYIGEKDSCVVLSSSVIDRVLKFFHLTNEVKHKLKQVKL